MILVREISSLMSRIFKTPSITEKKTMPRTVNAYTKVVWKSLLSKAAFSRALILASLEYKLLVNSPKVSVSKLLHLQSTAEVEAV